MESSRTVEYRAILWLHVTNPSLAICILRKASKEQVTQLESLSDIYGDCLCSFSPEESHWLAFDWIDCDSYWQWIVSALHHQVGVIQCKMAKWSSKEKGSTCDGYTLLPSPVFRHTKLHCTSILGFPSFSWASFWSLVISFDCWMLMSPESQGKIWFFPSGNSHFILISHRFSRHRLLVGRGLRKRLKCSNWS